MAVESKRHEETGVLHLLVAVTLRHVESDPSCVDVMRVGRDS